MPVMFTFDIHLVQSCDFSIMVVRCTSLCQFNKMEYERHTPWTILETTSRTVLLYTSVPIYRGLIIKCYIINIYISVLHIKLGTPYNNRLISKPDTTQYNAILGNSTKLESNYWITVLYNVWELLFHSTFRWNECGYYFIIIIIILCARWNKKPLLNNNNNKENPCWKILVIYLKRDHIIKL